jgi:hypothetical protein
MMKKVMFLVVMLLVASTCFAQLQSGPSNTVGYVKIVAVGDPAPGVQTVSTSFALPFVFWDVPVGGIPTYGTVSTNPSDIGGDQLNCGGALTADRILRQDNGQNAIRNSASGCAWTGGLETGAGMGPGRAYYYQNRTDANRNFVLAGEVNNSGNYLVLLIPDNAFTPYGWRDSRSVNRDDLNLLASGFQGGTSSLNSDRVVAQIGGANFWRRNSDNTWQGGLVTVEPGSAYYIHNRATGNGAWNYNYDASGNSLSVGVDPARRDDSGGSISKVGSSPTKSKAASSAGRQ